MNYIYCFTPALSEIIVLQYFSKSLISLILFVTQFRIYFFWKTKFQYDLFRVFKFSSMLHNLIYNFVTDSSCKKENWNVIKINVINLKFEIFVSFIR